MPIKFRCQKCRQLLGISRSQAGQHVDCPQCGRSVRVPLPKGRKPAKARTSQPANNLVSALEELSALSGDSSQARTSQARSDERQPEYATDTVASQAEPIESAPKNFAYDSDEYQQPVTLADSLSELAEFEPVRATSNEVSAELLSDMKAASNQRSAWPAVMLCSLIAGTVGFFGGWKFMPTGESTNPVEHIVAKPAGDESDKAIAAGANNTGETPSPAERSGRVNYQTDSGETRPDQGALVISLPAQHQGTWKLNAKAFRQPPDSTDRLAAVAALRAFGGDATTADAAGNFSLSARPNGTLLVVSRHAEQPEGVPNPVRIDLLATWFDSPSHLTGRLAVHVQNIDEDSQNDILFSK